jgi:hypothetical protein
MASSNYAEWCRTNPEWQELRRRRVLVHSPWCEACLAASATVVHHLTYEFGRIPPAWCLRAVCGPCHRALHQSWSDWCDVDKGMAR